MKIFIERGTLSKAAVVFGIVMFAISTVGIVRAAAGQRGIIVGTTRGTGTRGIIVGTTRETGTRGIVMGSCRNLQKRPIRNPSVGTDGTGKLLFALPDGRSMVLPDGIYKAQNGIRLHIRGGRISLVDGVLPR